MRNYVTPTLRLVNVNAKDVVTASNDVEYDVMDWLGGFVQ